ADFLGKNGEPVIDNWPPREFTTCTGAPFAGRKTLVLIPRFQEVKMAAAKPKSITKTEILKTLSDASGLNKKQVSSVLEGLAELVGKNIGKKGPGVIALPGLVKIRVVHKPATPAQKNVPNPFKPGELYDKPAKPARRQVKVQALKALKDVAK